VECKEAEAEEALIAEAWEEGSTIEATIEVEEVVTTILTKVLTELREIIQAPKIIKLWNANFLSNVSNISNFQQCFIFRRYMQIWW
jgi:hypothetical protein